jgi:hypothetical protein
LLIFLPWLACDPSNLHVLSSWDYRCVPSHPALFFLFKCVYIYESPLKHCLTHSVSAKLVLTPEQSIEVSIC